MIFMILRKKIVRKKISHSTNSTKSIKYIKKLPAFSMFELAISLVISGMFLFGAVSLFTIVSKKKCDTLINSISSIKHSIEIFKTINDGMPGDLFSSSIQSSTSGVMKNNACGNGDGVIAFHSLCGTATVNTYKSKCNVASYTDANNNFQNYNEALLFAKHLSDFGIIEKRLSNDLTNFYNTQLSYQNTISTGYNKTVFIPMLFSSSSTVSFGFARSDKNHTIIISSLNSFMDTSSSNAIYQQNQVINTTAAASSQILNGSTLCVNPIMPSFSINFKDADYIDKKIDNGVRNTGSFKHCPNYTTCDINDKKSNVIIGFLQKSI